MEGSNANISWTPTKKGHYLVEIFTTIKKLPGGDEFMANDFEEIEVTAAENDIIK